ncbi:hypothetical protein ACSBR2_012610 [Camellia fascicularis]
MNLWYIDLHSNLLQGPLPIPPNTTIVFSISDNNLTGEIPPLICDLRLLEVLDLSNNSLSGLIPQCLGNLSNSLSVLNLGINSFRGTFTTTFTKGNVLWNLNLNGNQIEGQVPRSLLNCRHLEVLDLGKNKINDTFPHWLGTLRNLQVLVLRFNRFHGHIGTFKTKGKHPFPKLRIIDMSYNDFTGLLPTNYIKQFEAMMNVDEHEMKLKYMGHIPTSLGNLTNLESLDLSSNKLVGEIPQQLASLMFLELRELHLDALDISSLLPHALLNLSSLTSLSLSSCQLRGKFPENIFHLPNLQKLELWDNREPNCNIASSLQIINLSRTNFSSQVPDSISNLKALNNVYLIERNFLGSIPAFLGNLNKSPICTSCIIVLAVKSPYRFQTLQSLLTSFLSNNNLNRQLPDSIGNMSQLAFLNLSGNQLTGPIPLYTIGLSRLTYLDLKNNSLNGTIPSWSFTLPSLVSKELRDNKLQGQIPGSVYELVNLTQLSLSSNNLSGIVELYKLLKLKCLSHLDLSYNGLSLSINNSVNSTMPKFYTVGLASCNLSECPNFLRVQAEFLSLDLSNNKIGGEVPKWALDVGEKFIKGFRSF